MHREGSSACLDDGHQAFEVDMTMTAEATPAAVDEEGASLELQDSGEELAADPEVARLLSELQTELDADGSDGSDTEDGGDEEREREGGEDGKNEDENDGGDDDSNHGCLEAAAGKPESEQKYEPSARREQQLKESSLTGPARSHPQTESYRQDGQERGTIDISRMKIDAPQRCNRQRGGPRPRSAPSACLSAGGFSRLSSRASSSSRLSRAVSQKLLQAMKEKEAEEELAVALSEAPGRGGAEVEAALRQRSINVVKQNAEALQVRQVLVLRLCWRMSSTSSCCCAFSGEALLTLRSSKRSIVCNGSLYCTSRVVGRLWSSVPFGTTSEGRLGAKECACYFIPPRRIFYATRPPSYPFSLDEYLWLRRANGSPRAKQRR